MAIQIDGLPINSMVIFHGKMLVHQRVRENDEKIMEQYGPCFKNPKFYTGTYYFYQGTSLS